MLVRRLGLGLASIFFGLLLIVTAIDIGLVRVVTRPATVKRTVADSGVYNDVVPSVLAQQKSISTNLGVIPTSNPIIQNAANVALPPQFIQENTEAIIDNIYQWLNGQIAAPNFNVTLAGARVLFANNIADSVQSQLSALPACRTVQQSLNFSVLNASCLPAGLSPSTAAEQAKASLLKEEGFLDKAVLSANDIKLNSLQENGSLNLNSNEPAYFERPEVKRLPKLYRLAKQSPWILLLLSILVGTAVFLLSASRRKGLRLIGVILTVTGIFMLIFSWGFNRVIGQRAVPHLKASTLLLQAGIRKIALNLEQQVDKNYWYAGGLYSGLGLAAIGGSIIGRRVVPAAENQRRPGEWGVAKTRAPTSKTSSGGQG